MTPSRCRCVVAGSVTCMMFCNLCELCGLSMAALHAAWICYISCGCCTLTLIDFVHSNTTGSVRTDMIPYVSFRSLSSTLCKISHLLTAPQRVLKASERKRSVSCWTTHRAGTSQAQCRHAPKTLHLGILKVALHTTGPLLLTRWCARRSPAGNQDLPQCINSGYMHQQWIHVAACRCARQQVSKQVASTCQLHCAPHGQCSCMPRLAHKPKPIRPTCMSSA